MKTFCPRSKRMKTMPDKPAKSQGFKSKRKDGKGHRKKIDCNFELIQKEVNIHQVIYWIGLQATAEEIAGSFNVSVDTLDRRLREEFGLTFAEFKKKLGNGASGKLSLRKYQFDQAKKNPSMAIWLGKQWLGQKDTIVNETVVKDETVKIYIPDNGRDQCQS